MLNKFVKQLGQDEVILWEGAYSPLFILFKWNNQKFYTSLYKTPASPIFEVIEGRNAMLLFNGSHYAAYAREAFIKYWNNPIEFDEQFSKCKSLSTQINESYKKYVLVSASDLSEGELIDMFSEVHNLLAELVATSIFIELFDKNSILNAVNEVSQGLLDNIWEKATHPAFESFEIRQLKYVMGEIENRPGLFHKTCQYIYTDYFCSKNDAEVMEILNNTAGGATKMSENIKKVSDYAEELKIRGNEFEIWLNSLSQVERKLVEYIQLVMEARDWRKDPIAQAQNLLSIFGKELLKRSGVADELVQYVLPVEFEEGIKALQEKKADIVNRPNGMVAFVDVEGNYKIISTDISGIKKEVQGISVGHDKVKSLKGQIGASGKASGIVKVVKDMSEASKFENGDILVTGMTRPEFVPLMKMAAAIVTNEGGITCHAAIVARELKKPCVIGTKVATQVFKDGDLVEVDAIKGVVNLLSV